MFFHSYAALAIRFLLSAKAMAEAEGETDLLEDLVEQLTVAAVTRVSQI